MTAACHLTRGPAVGWKGEQAAKEERRTRAQIGKFMTKWLWERGLFSSSRDRYIVWKWERKIRSEKKVVSCPGRSKEWPTALLLEGKEEWTGGCKMSSKTTLWQLFQYDASAPQVSLASASTNQRIRNDPEGSLTLNGPFPLFFCFVNYSETSYRRIF